MDMLKELRELKDTIAHEIMEANQEIKKSGGDLNTGDIEMIDKLTHAMKSLVTTCAMLEAEDDGYSGSRYYMGNDRREGYSGNTSGIRYGYGRDSRNNYGYSRNGSMNEHLRQMLDEAPDESTRMEIKKLMDKINQR